MCVLRKLECEYAPRRGVRGPDKRERSRIQAVGSRALVALNQLKQSSPSASSSPSSHQQTPLPSKRAETDDWLEKSQSESKRIDIGAGHFTRHACHVFFGDFHFH